MALGGFERLFGAKALDANRFIERDWLAEEWARGGPVSNLGPGVLSRHGRALREPAGAASLRGDRVRHHVVRLHGRRGALG